MPSSSESADELSIADLQRHIHQMYYKKDVSRGTDRTFMWLMEEIGELAAALRGDDRENLAEEFADVIASLTDDRECCRNCSTECGTPGKVWPRMPRLWQLGLRMPRFREALEHAPDCMTKFRFHCRSCRYGQCVYCLPPV